MKEQPARVGADGTVIAGVPIYVDQTTGQVAQGAVSLVLTQGSQSSPPFAVNIQQLPPLSTYGTQLGQISDAVLVMDAMLLGRKIGQLQAFQALPGNTIETSQAQATLNALLSATIQARSDVDSVALDNSVVVPGGNLPDGTTVQFDQTSLDMMDRVLAVFLSQTFANLDPSASSASKLAALPRSHRLRTATSQSFQTLLSDLEASSDVTGFELNALTAQNLCSSNPVTTACLVDAASVVGAVGGAYANQSVTMTGTPGNTLLGSTGGILASLNTIGSAFGDLAAFVNGLASGNQAILNAAVTDMNNATTPLYGALVGLLQTTALGELAEIKPVLAGSSTVLNYIQIVDQQSQGLQNVNSTTADLTNLYHAPLPSNQGIGIATGIANIFPNTQGIVSPQSGLNLCCFGSSNIGVTGVADPSGNYELFVPLQSSGTNYSNLNLTAFDPLTDETLASETVNLSGLTSTTPVQLPPIPPTSGETWVGTVTGTTTQSATSLGCYVSGSSGTWSFSYQVSLTFNGSLVSALQSSGSMIAGSGSASGTQVVTVQFPPNSDNCQLLPSSLSNATLLVDAFAPSSAYPYAQIQLEGPYPSMIDCTSDITFGVVCVDPAYLALQPSSISSTQISGVYPSDSGNQGNFTLTKQ